MGANGVGKTTLINLLLKKEKPDFGVVRLGESLSIAMFDQNKDLLPSETTLWNFFSGTTESKLTGRNEYLMVQDRPRHILSYLNEFLFTPEQVYGRIKDLSGGEKSRLLLAVLMAKPSNMLVLDEPTNDLDLETLDLLKELIIAYKGTVIFVSHDRDFIDSIASYTIMLKKQKPIIIQSGGFSNFRNSTLPDSYTKNKNSKRKKTERQTKKSYSSNAPNQILSKKLFKIEKEIEKLSYEIKKLELFLSNENLYSENKAKFEVASKELISRQKKREEAEEKWFELEKSNSND